MQNMRYVWDPQKRLSNLKKHDVDFVDAIGVLEDEFALTKSVIEGGEYRFKTLGIGSKPGVLLVVHSEEVKMQSQLSALVALIKTKDGNTMRV